MNSFTVDQDRRSFIKAGAAVAGGLVLKFPLTVQSQAGAAPLSFNSFIRIGTDDLVTIVIHKPENGQGAVTALSMLVAEELQCDWERIRWEFAPIDRAYGFPLQGTFGSMGMRTSWQPLRQAGATARELLLQAAANRWDADKSDCIAESGRIRHRMTGAVLRFGELAEAAAALPVPEDVPLKPKSAFQTIGRPMPRLDTPAKVNGSAKFGIDVRVPGMLFAVLERCPVFGGTLADFDATETRRVPGVIDVVAVSRGVAVVAANTWAAIQGRKALTVNWNAGPNAALTSDTIRQLQLDLTGRSGAVARNAGDSAAALRAAVRRHEAIYEAPYLAHATLEPPNTLASVTADACELWSGTQIPGIAHSSAVAASGLTSDQVKVNTCYIGGGFGGRGGGNVYGEAVEIAKIIGRPVQLLYTREDDIRQDRYRPASLARLAAALDADGWPTAWTGHVACQYFQSLQNGVDREAVAGLANLSYAFPNVHFEYSPLELDIPTNFWRSVGCSQNTYFAEAFLDELAALTGKDPVDYRRRLLAGDTRLLNVLNVAAERAGWGSAAPSGRYRGVAAVNCFGSANAQIAEVSIDNDRLRVHRVTCVVDCGQAVNPSAVVQQLQGGIVYGLSAALKGAITLDNGRVRQSNFHDYDVLRMDEMPHIDVHIVDSDLDGPQGIGEVGTPAIAPAVVNAVFSATGRPIRRLPIRPEDLVQS